MTRCKTDSNETRDRASSSKFSAIIYYYYWHFAWKASLNNDPRSRASRRHARGKYICSRRTGEGGKISRFRQVISPATKKKDEGNCSRLHQRLREEGPPIRSNIVSSVANITASSGSTPCNARWDVNGAAGSPNEDKSYPKWRPYLFPAPPFAFFPPPLPLSLRLLSSVINSCRVRHFSHPFAQRMFRRFRISRNYNHENPRSFFAGQPISQCVHRGSVVFFFQVIKDNCSMNSVMNDFLF